MLFAGKQFRINIFCLIVFLLVRICDIQQLQGPADTAFIGALHRAMDDYLRGTARSPYIGEEHALFYLQRVLPGSQPPALIIRELDQRPSAIRGELHAGRWVQVEPDCKFTAIIVGGSFQSVGSDQLIDTAKHLAGG